MNVFVFFPILICVTAMIAPFLQGGDVVVVMFEETKCVAVNEISLLVTISPLVAKHKPIRKPSCSPAMSSKAMGLKPECLCSSW